MGRIVVGSDNHLQGDMLNFLHDGALGSHSASELQANQAKSALYFGGVKDTVKAQIQQALGYSYGDLPFKYLGVPLSTKKITLLQWQPLTKKIVVKVSSWTAKKLSYAGRVQFVRSVIFGVQAYWAQLFIIPAKVMKAIQAYCRSYIWSGVNVITKRALISWEKICLPKVVGGINLINLKLWNKAAILKLCWNIEQKQDKLWIKWVHNYYIKGRNLKNLVVPAQASRMVRKMLGAKCNLHLMQHVPRTKTSVIKQAYLKVLGTFLKVDWRVIICRNLARPNAIFTTWLQQQDRLLTVDRLLKWHVQADPICIMYKQQDESRGHLFIECRFANALWLRLLRWLQHSQLHLATWDSMNHWVIRRSKGKRHQAQLWKLVYAKFVYVVWKERNARTFQKKECTVDTVARQIACICCLRATEPLRNILDRLALISESKNQQWSLWEQEALWKKRNADSQSEMAYSAQTLDISGDRQSGQDVRTQNVTACQAVANIVKSSLGPVGLDKFPFCSASALVESVESIYTKMLVDDIGDVTITNDGATILRMLEVEHPAAKVLVELAELQDREVGDGTTSVVIIAAELLKGANELVRHKIHPTSIISGYRLAMREACKYVEEKLAVKVDKLGKDSLINCAKTSMSSKLIADDSDFFANMVVEAVQAVKMTNVRGEIKYPIKGINLLKAHGKSAKDSYLMKGYALNTGRAAQGMPMSVAPARIACLDFNLQKTKMQMGVQVLVTDPRELERIRQRTSWLDQSSMLSFKPDYFVEAGAIAVRRVRKEDLRHVAKATGATVVSTFADMEGEETFEPSFLGHADEVVEERVADDDVIMVKGTKTTSSVSIILRGANDFMLDEMERALHDALCIVKRTLESTTVVAGGGAVEAALCVYLEYLATTLGSREQLAIAQFAESLLVIPKVLANNAAKDSSDLVSKLRSCHYLAQTKADKKHLSSMGLDLAKGAVRNNLEAGVIEPAMSKVKIIQFATEAAITILRIDDMIRLVKDESQNDE
ncbi:T-complex protein 1 subunit alpha [Capsicum annuum]|uniref:T-complex protein 1 subunit alpha n=1 Tax=Capsicum annuum TaxID=4072 RepID=A0A2G3AMG9_CAPAN|nr:T-complex protein 1 subunit alpha [Capsicum annuum]